MVEVIADASTLKRSDSGSITGEVFLRASGSDFPETGWSDFLVVILGWWIGGLTEVVARQNRSFQGMFMDGPFAFTIHRGVGECGLLEWGESDNQVAIGEITVSAFLRSAVEAGKGVAAECLRRNWTSRDLRRLERAISSSAF